MAQERVTGFSGVPSTFYLLLARTNLSDADLSSLRYITQAGGPMTSSAIQKIREQLPHAQFWVMYGQTEATARLSYLPPQCLEEKLGSVGVPLPGTELSIQDKEGNVLEPNTIGEICARGPHIMLGYWRDPDQTDHVLRGGWLHTGDLGRTDNDGYYYIEGRSSDMIKTGAHRISPREIEEVVALLDTVAESAAVGVADELLGQVIRLVVVAKPNRQISKREVMAHCRERLAHYKIPKEVVFMEDLPRTASGKLQRFKLLKQ
jgi:acyl-CoA synthetase (AMP-forming)/AMP-acid ligase II